MSTSVFLSSTAKDLAEYREAAYRAIRGLGYDCIRMEDFGARDWSAQDFCRTKIGECDLLIGIVGHLHGSSPPSSEKSFTELEYEAALDYEKPNLMFLASERLQLPIDLIQQELKKDPNKLDRQSAFRQRVSENRICGFFSSPDELSRLIQQAMHNRELQLQKSDNSEPNVGSLVPLTCDRTDQEADFRKYFSHGLTHYPGSPQFYLVHGEERESHGSLVKRLCETRIQQHAHNKWGEQKGTVTVWEVDWPSAEGFESRRAELEAGLFEMIDPRSPVKENYDYSPAALAAHLSASLNSVVIIQHEISASAWDKTTVALIEWYLKFWAEVKSAAEIPQCLVFLNVLYSNRESRPLWQLVYALKRLYQKFCNWRIKKQLREVETRNRALSSGSQTCPFVILRQLTCVKPEDVMRWLRRHKLCDDDGDREQHCTRIFATNGKMSTCKNMRDVEHALNKLHKGLIRRRVEI